MSETQPHKKISILGATGSVGQSAIAVIGEAGTQYSLCAMAAQSDAAELRRIMDRLGPEQRPGFVAVAAPEAYAGLKDAFADYPDVETGAGDEAVLQAAQMQADIVVGAISGIAGLAPCLAALESGHDLALANKEAIVASGPIMQRAAAKSGARILPVDSEHNAIFQVLERHNKAHVKRLVLTASGGPFLGRERQALRHVTPEEAIAHPNWSMGAKISVDSATLMNKGLELIEAHHLFDMPSDQIDIVMHPQSVIHSLVEYNDGSSLAQLGPPDMRVPMASCLAWPGRLDLDMPRLDLAALGKLTFEAPDMEHFPALRLAREALEAGQAATIILNAANEMAVHAFLDGHIGFLDITAVVEDSLSHIGQSAIHDLEAVFALDKEARRHAAAAFNETAAST